MSPPHASTATSCPTAARNDGCTQSPVSCALEREVLELPAADAQQLVVFLPADDDRRRAPSVAPGTRRHARVVN